MTLLNPIEAIDNADGRTLFSMMKRLKKLLDNHDPRPDVKLWWNSCFDRAKFLTKDRFGDWDTACSNLKNIREPTLSGEMLENKHLEMTMPNVMGYTCQYIRHITSDGKKSWFAIQNGKLNKTYTHQLSQVTENQVKNIFYN